MAKRSSKATIIWLLILLFIVIWVELVMVVKFFTEEYLMRDTTEKDVAEAMVEYYVLDKDEKPLENVIEEIPIKEVAEDEILKEVKDTASNSNSNSVNDLEVKKEVRENTISSRARSVDDSIKKVEPEISSDNQTKKEDEDNNLIPSIYQGYSTIGKIEIPKTGVNMYILSNQTVGGMEIAACQLYTTGELNKSGKTLIVGHNYRNGKLFSNNNKLSNGDIIKVTTLDGIVKTYTIYNKIVTTPEDVSFLLEDSDRPEIILSCCSDDNVSRIVIMAK